MTQPEAVWPPPPPEPPQTPWRQRLATRPLWQKIVTPIAAIAALAIGGLLISDAAVDTQDEIASRCQEVLDDSAPGSIHADHRPDECEGLTDENWTLLHLNWVLEGEGIYDDLNINTD